MAKNKLPSAQEILDRKYLSQINQRLARTSNTASVVGKVNKKQLGTSSGLYNYAAQNGLQRQADSILKQQSGEETDRIFSGGFISDVFDVLNAAQYGVVGMLKGKSFGEGVQTRESWTKQDALGKYGIPGLIGGTLLDIASDPFTYLTPWKVLSKIPGVTKLAKAAKAGFAGKLAVKTIEEAGGINKSYMALEGGTKLGRYLGTKFVWMFGADPVFKEFAEKAVVNEAVSIKKAVDMVTNFSRLGDDVASKAITKDEVGRIVRLSNDALKGVVSPEEYKIISKLNDKIDELGKELVDLGVLGKGKYEDNINQYIKNVYEEYEKKAVKKGGGVGKLGIKNFKRKEVEDIAELGVTQIDKPAYLYMKTLMKMSKDVEEAKFFKQVADKFGTTVAQDGFSLISKTGKFMTTGGLQADILTGVKKINDDLKPAFKELKQTFKADKKILSEISSIEDDLVKYSSMRGDELYKFFSEGAVVDKVSTASRKLGTIPEALQDSANAVKKFDNFDTFYKSVDGIKVEKLFLDGTLERNGFSSVKKFFDTVKNPYKPATQKLVKETLEGSPKKIVELQKKVEKLTERAGIKKTIDKTSINDSFINLEKKIDDLVSGKENLLDELENAKLGDLAGKYVPNNIKEYLSEIINPAQDSFTKSAVRNFKFFKVVMNPATHARNMVSNKLLNWWKLGMNPLDPRTVAAETEAIAEIAKGTGKWMDMARPLGYNLDTFASQELKYLLDTQEVGAMAKGIKGWQKAKKALGNVYQQEENAAKLSAFIFNMKKGGVTAEQAWKMAESATFNYAQVTPFVRKLRESIFGMPFITFTIKSTPAVIETAIKNPARISVIGKIKRAIEQASDIGETEREKASEPSWVKDGFYVKLPMKDKQGRSAYFDLTYILPFGDLVSGNFFERNQDISTGLPESQAQNLMKKSPFIQLVSELGKNKDFYGNKIWRDSDDQAIQLKDVMRHITKSYIPPLIGDQIAGGYNDKGERQYRGVAGALKNQQDPATIAQRRNLQQELLRMVGAKVQPINADLGETYQEWNRKKALQTLLLENGLLSSFEVYNPPKEE